MTGGSVPNSNLITFNTAGSYYWQAVYSGDANNASATSVCTSEPLTVGKASPTIGTTLSASSITAGNGVNDSATLSGATSGAGGSVTYTVYTDNGCTLNPEAAGTETVTGGSVPNSNLITFNTAGSYYWQAVYSGDANNASATSVCTSEPLTVGKASPTIGTTLSASSITAGNGVNDSATLSGATSGAGGSVTYTVYTDNGCTLNPEAAGTETVTGGSVPNSNLITFNTAGSYYWQAVYSGDANNASATSVCTSEPLKVTSATLGDYVWNDANANGIQDSGESGIAGVTVTLYDSTGKNILSTTTTDANGLYHFTKLAPGTYVVGFTLPSGYAFSPQYQGSNPALDSNANPATGMTDTITLTAGETDNTIDAGMYQPASMAAIGDYVWNDANVNGIQDSTETGIPNVTVKLYDFTGKNAARYHYYRFHRLLPLHQPGTWHILCRIYGTQRVQVQSAICERQHHE